MKSSFVMAQQMGYHTVLNVIRQIPDMIMTARMKHIEGIEFLSLLGCEQFYLSIQITKIAKCQLEFLTRLPGLQRIKQHRGLTDRVKGSVDPAGAIVTSHLVDTQGNLCQRKPTGIALLPHITLQ